MILAIIPVISVVASLVLICPLLIGYINIKEVNKSPLKIIFISCLIYSILEVIGWIYAYNSWQNHFLSNSVVYINIVFWGYYYVQIINSKNLRLLIGVLSVITLLLSIWSHFGRDFNRIDSFAHSVSNILFILIVLIFFYQLLNSLNIDNLFTYSHFWIGMAVLIYFSGVFFMNVFAEYIAFSKDQSIRDYWEIKEYLTFLHRIFLAIGLWFSKTPLQLKSSSK